MLRAVHKVPAAVSQLFRWQSYQDLGLGQPDFKASVHPIGTCHCPSIPCFILCLAKEKLTAQFQHIALSGL